MYKFIYPEKDATIYERFPYRNTGTDQILELTKAVRGTPSIFSLSDNESIETFGGTYNSRILIKFNLSSIQADISSGKITGSPEYYLRLRATETIEIPVEYSVYAYPISGSWINGTGFFNNNPQITNGVSWAYKNSKLLGNSWETSSYNTNTTASWSTTPGGANWFTSSFASQSFSHESADVWMNVTSIVNSWLSGSISNSGFVVKFSDSDESSLDQLGSIKFFSNETHTIFVPKLEVYWNSFTNSGNITEITSDDFVLYCKNLKESYKENEISTLKIGVRERYPNTTYSTSSMYLSSYRLPTGSYFQIADVITNDIVVPYHVNGTKINCDSNGNYVKLDFNSFMPERYYKINFEVNFSDGSKRIIDENFIFKVI